MAGYYGTGYWHANYWHANYWGEYEAPSVDGQYWHENYWHANYWADGYWATASTTQYILQANTPQLGFTTSRNTVEITANIQPATQVLTLTSYATDTSNDVTVEATLETLTLTAISPSQDAGEYYEGDINFSVYMASSFDWTDTVLATTPTLSLSAINPGVTADTGATLVQITSTPALAFTQYDCSVSNNVTVEPLTPSLSLTAYDVDTGFGSLAQATLETLTLTPRQANVTGTNADINEIDATLETLSLTTYNATVEAATALRRRKGGRVKKRKRYLIEVDNKFFDVVSPQEAQRVFEQVAELAEENRITKKPKINITTAKGNKVTSKPVLKALEKTRQRINKVIKSNVVPMTRSTVDEEIAKLMQLALDKEIQEDDDAILALLMM